MNDLLFQLGAIAIGAALIAAVVSVVWVLGRHYQRKRMLAIEHWCSSRSAMTDQEFLAACGIPAEPLQMNVAIHARNIIAEYTGVPPATIGPDDNAAAFGCLLDCMDWLDVWFRIEKEANARINRKSFDRTMLVGRDNKSRMKDFIKAVSSAATKAPPPKGTGGRNR